MHYPIKVFYSEEDKGFIAVIPDLPGCSAFGKTEEEAIKQVKIAQELWIKTAKREGRKIPLSHIGGELRVAQAFGGDTMKNIMTYKGYVAYIEFDQRDNIFTGKVMGIEDNITFHGTTVKELKTDFEAAINHYIADCAATGRKLFKPCFF